jgi:hypothetical protein
MRLFPFVRGWLWPADKCRDAVGLSIGIVTLRLQRGGVSDMTFDLTTVNASPFEATVTVTEVFLVGPWGGSPAPRVSVSAVLRVGSDYHRRPLDYRNKRTASVYGGVDGGLLSVLAGGVGISPNAPKNTQATGSIEVSGTVETNGRASPFTWRSPAVFHIQVGAPNATS